VTAKRILVFAMALMLLAPALAWGKKVPGVTAKTITVGVSTPLSGGAALWGTTALGMKAWADYVNSRGGVCGRKINLIIMDDGYNPTRTMLNLKQMRKKVFAIVGLLGSAPNAAAKNFFPKNKIPLITPYANCMIFAKQPKKKQRWYFVTYPDYENENELLATFAINKLGAKKIAHFYQNDDFGNQAKVGVATALKKAKGKAKLVASIAYEFTERSLTSYALKLKASGADAVILTTSPIHTIIMVKTLAKIGYKPNILTNFTVGDPIFYKLAGPAYEGVYISAAGNTGMPGADPAADRVANILKKFNPKLAGREYLAVFGAVSMMHFLEGAKRACPKLTRWNLIKALETIHNWRPEGLGAPVTYNRNRHHGVNAVRMSRAIKGKIVPLVPGLKGYTIFKPRF
jgi:branched-chain amino acid transport system substrate-binding protein